MKSDHIFYELFRDHPEWLRDFTGLPLPQGCKGSSQILKQLEIRCDLLLEPIDLTDPWYIIEFQLYLDHSIFNRIDLSKNILWKQLNRREDCRRKNYLPQEVETVIIFGSQCDCPPGRSLRHPLTKTLFIDVLLEGMEAKQPTSPLLAALAPLKDSLSDLEKKAAQHYDVIRNSLELKQADREILHEIFLNLLLQRFKSKSHEEIRAMIAELTPIKKTRVGQELLKEGIEEGIKQMIRKMMEHGQTVEQICQATGYSVDDINRFLKD